MKNVLILSLFCLLTLIGCASYTPPQQQNIEDARVLNVDYDAAWSKAMQWVNESDLIVDNTDKASGFIKASGSVVKLADIRLKASGMSQEQKVSVCGQCGIAGTNFVPTELRMNIFLNKENNQVKVRVKIEFSKFLPEPACPEFKCVSNGRIEKSLFDYIQN